MNKVLLSPIFFLALYSSIFAQQSEVPGLQQNYNIDVVKVYEKVVEDGYESVQIFQKLANSHYSRGNYIQARKWFEKWFNLDKTPERIAYLKFSKTLQALNEIEKAKHYLLLYENSTEK